MKTLIAASAVVLTAFAASASVNSSEISTYAPGVDVSTLSDTQVNSILSVIHSDDSASEKRAFIQALAK